MNLYIYIHDVIHLFFYNKCEQIISAFLLKKEKRKKLTLVIMEADQSQCLQGELVSCDPEELMV